MAGKRGKKRDSTGQNVEKEETLATQDPQANSDTESDEVSNKKARSLSDDTAAKGVKLAIEHCKSWRVFGRRASELVEALREELGEVDATMNAKAPRRGTFEVVMIKDDDSEVLLWSGHKKGPPRKTKFPEAQVIIDAIKENM